MDTKPQNLLFPTLSLPDIIPVVFLPCWLQGIPTHFSYISLLQKGPYKSFHPSIFSHAHPCVKSLEKTISAVNWTKHRASLVGSSALPRYQSCVPTALLPHSGPSQLGRSWGFTLLPRIRSRRPPAAAGACVCPWLCDCDQQGEGRPRKAGAVAQQPPSASPFCPCCLHIVLNLESLGRTCAGFLPWGSGAILNLRLWYKNHGWKGCEPAASSLCDNRQCVETELSCFF